MGTNWAMKIHYKDDWQEEIEKIVQEQEQDQEQEQNQEQHQKETFEKEEDRLEQLQTFVGEGGELVSIPRHIAKERWDLGSTIYLRVGYHQLELPYIVNETNNSIYIPKHVGSQLGLVNGMTCSVSNINDTLQLGPVIGILVSKTYIYRLLDKQKAKRRTMELIKANREANTILYFFALENVDLNQKKVFGTYYDEREQRWKKERFSLPDVLYERGGGRDRKTAHYRQIKSFFSQHPNVKKLNAVHYFDKWDLHRKLSKFKEIQPYLPHTSLYQTKRDFYLFKNKKKVYVKRCVSSNGRQVMRVSQLPDKHYQFSFYANGVVEKKVKKLSDVTQEMERYFKGKKVIIQEAIDLLQVNESIMDMRATLQRDGKGQLGITAIAARVGYKKSPVTSTRTGSTCYQFEAFYRQELGYSEQELKKLKQRIEHFLYRVYECIEKAYGSFGELGIDFAIDQNGKIWLIEGNAKPAKSALYQSFDQKIIRKAFVSPLEYAKYMSAF